MERVAFGEQCENDATDADKYESNESPCEENLQSGKKEHLAAAFSA